MNRHPFVVFCWLLFWLYCAQTHAQETTAKTPPEQTEIQSVINTLENPEAWERLIGQLKLLVRTQQEMADSGEKPSLGGTTVDLLKTLSDQLASSVETTVKAATLIHKLLSVADWLKNQLSNLDRRNRWLGIEVGREFNRRMKKRFDQLAIEISSQSLTVYMGRNRQDRLPPDNTQNNQVGHKET